MKRVVLLIKIKRRWLPTIPVVCNMLHKSYLTLNKKLYLIELRVSIAYDTSRLLLVLVKDLLDREKCFVKILADLWEELKTTHKILDNTFDEIACVCCICLSIKELLEDNEEVKWHHDKQ